MLGDVGERDFPARSSTGCASDCDAVIVGPAVSSAIKARSGRSRRDGDAARAERPGPRGGASSSPSRRPAPSERGRGRRRPRRPRLHLRGAARRRRRRRGRPRRPVDRPRGLGGRGCSRRASTCSSRSRARRRSPGRRRCGPRRRIARSRSSRSATTAASTRAGWMRARRVREGAIGRPLLVLGVARDVRTPEPEDPAPAGGFLVDMASHDYDAACWFLGQEPVEVFAARQSSVYPELEALGDLDNAAVTVRFDGGGIAALHISRTCPWGHDVRVEIVGDEGSVLVGNAASRPGRDGDDARRRRGVPAGLPRALRRRVRRRARRRSSPPAGRAAAGGRRRSRTTGARSRSASRRARAPSPAARSQVGPDWPWP